MRRVIVDLLIIFGWPIVFIGTWLGLIEAE